MGKGLPLFTIVRNSLSNTMEERDAGQGTFFSVVGSRRTMGGYGHRGRLYGATG